MCKMQSNRRLKLFLYLAVAAVAVAADQLTKYLAVLYLKPIHSFPLWQDVFHLTYLENRGAAFGMLQNQRWLFLVVTLLTVAIIVAYILYDKKMRVLTGIALALIAGGGVGNLIDRMATGAVVDFLDFTLINFAIFNVADICVCVGAGLFLLSYILEEISVRKAQKDEKTDA